MFRHPFFEPFCIRFHFVDIADEPVSLVNADVNIFLVTRALSPGFPAYCGNGVLRNCESVDDSTLQVFLPPKSLFAGKLSAKIELSGIVEADNVSARPVHIDMAPDIPVEFVDRFNDHHDPYRPINGHNRYFGPPGMIDDVESFMNHAQRHEGLEAPLVKCRLSMRNPRFVRLVTSDQLEQKLKDAAVCLCPEDSELANADDIAGILDKFKIIP